MELHNELPVIKVSKVLSLILRTPSNSIKNHLKFTITEEKPKKRGVPRENTVQSLKTPELFLRWRSKNYAQLL